MSQPPPPPRTLRLAMLNADTPVPTILPKHPTYGALFHYLLTRTAESNPLTSHLSIESTNFNLHTLSFPPSPPPFDAMIISGSASSAYDHEPWIVKLKEYLKDMYEKYPHVRIFGSCFGHQIICSSLFGMVVEPDPKGWEIGAKHVTLHPEFLATFPYFPPTLNSGRRGQKRDMNEKGGKGEKMSVKLQFIHHDHVLLPSPAPTPTSSTPSTPTIFPSLPPTWLPIGHTPHCAMQGVYQPNRVFTLQGHFEFDKYVNGEVVRHFFAEKWEAERVEEALREIDADDDADVVAGMVLGFLLGWDGRKGWGEGEGGLITPPEEG